MTAYRSPVDSWWRDGVCYQLYLKSFADSDGDGVGDLMGVVDHLDHLVDLGVDAVWLNPCYPSPNLDGGYDVADFTTVDDRYGGMDALAALRDACHARGLRLLMDLVPNHCSAQHAWFQEALAAPPGSPARARFHFAEGKGDTGADPPNNWVSTFGGPAWTRVPDGQWYLHSFDSSQPDFNWDNEDVASMFDDVLRTWFDRGIDGFRIDVAYAMVKADGLPDTAPGAKDNPYQWNQPGVHDVFARWRRIADSYELPRVLVGEVWLPPADVADYVRPGELHQAFYFDLLQQPFTARDFRHSVQSALDALGHEVGGVPAWTLNNHDVHRAVTRYGLYEREPMSSPDQNALRTRARGKVDIELGTQRALAALLFVLALPGSVYLFQGEELGLPEVQDLPDEARQDPIWERSDHTEYGRDGCRVPLPWSAHAPHLGFSTSQPWLPQPATFASFAVDRQRSDPVSTLSFYRAALTARRSIDPTAGLEWVEEGEEDVVVFRRGSLTCVVAFDGAGLQAPQEWGKPVLTTPRVIGRFVPASAAAWLLR